MTDAWVVLFLVAEFWKMGCMGLGCQGRSAHLVPTPEAGAVLFWQQQRADSQWVGRSGRLYRLDLNRLVVTELPLPVVEFKK